MVQNCEIKFTLTPQNPIEYKSGSRSIAVGNFDNDEWLDIVVASRVVDSISVFLGYNSGTFANKMTYSTGSFSAPYIVAVDDFNNNHQIDIAVAYFGINSIGIFLGFGNGSFTNKIVISTGSSRPIWIHTADLDNDELHDSVTANYGTDSISIFYGYGDGSFSYPITYSTGYDSSPFSIITGDFNHESYSDLANANYDTNNIATVIANGNRTFFTSTNISNWN